MKKKVLSVLLCAAMTATLLAGCGSNEDTPAQPETPAEPVAEAPAEPAAPAETPAETPAGEIPQDYKYYFSFDEPDPAVHLASRPNGTVEIVEGEPLLVDGVKGKAVYVDGVNGLKLDVNGVGQTYTVSFWVNPSRFAQYMPTLQYGPDMHGDATGGQHYVNFTWASWNPTSDELSYPSVWAYDQNAEGSPWPNWYTDVVDDHNKRWTNVTMTVDPANTNADGTLIIADLYVDGEKLVGTDAEGNERPVYVVQNTMEPSDNFDFLLGVNYWDAIMKGAFDEVYVYDYVLDASQVKALYTACDATAKYEEPAHDFVVTPTEGAIDTLGTTDLTMGFWSDWTEGVELKDGETKIVNLHNFSDGAATWDNYVVGFCNGKNEAHTIPNDMADYKEYLVVRADAYAWTPTTNSGDNADEFDINYSWGNWTTWQTQVMQDANVTLKISRKDNTITVDATQVDYNTTENTCTLTAKNVDIAADDPCYFFITGEHCYIDIMSIKDDIKADPNAKDTLGALNLVQAFWSDATDGFELADGATKTVKLNNYSDGKNNWDNFVIAFANTEVNTDALPSADNYDGYAEYGVLRADAYGWGDASFAYEATTSWGDDWAGWLAMMQDADVTLKITRNGGEVSVDFTFVGADGSEWTENITFTSTMDASSPVYFFFTNENSYVELLSVE